MKTFKQYLTEAGKVLFAAWILPDGTLQQVPFFGHEKYVAEHPGEFGLTPKQVKKTDLIKKLAIQNGAVRIHVFKDNPTAPASATIGATKPSMFRNKREIHDILMTYGVKTYHFYEAGLGGNFLGVKEIGLYESVENIKIYKPMKDNAVIVKEHTPRSEGGVSWGRIYFRVGGGVYKNVYFRGEGEQWNKATNAGRTEKYWDIVRPAKYMDNGYDTNQGMTYPEFEEWFTIENI